MYAKYIKREIPDLNGTGRTQAYYQMELTPKSYEEFVSQCAREGWRKAISWLSCRWSVRNWHFAWQKASP